MPKKPPFRRPEWESAALKAFALRERRYDILSCAFDIILPETEPREVTGNKEREPTWQEDLQKAREIRAAGRDVAHQPTGRESGRGR